jgi:hypothetical protein
MQCCLVGRNIDVRDEGMKIGLSWSIAFKQCGCQCVDLTILACQASSSLEVIVTKNAREHQASIGRQ